MVHIKHGQCHFCVSLFAGLSYYCRLRH